MNTNHRLWEYRWARDVFALVVLAGLVYFLYAARAVTVPIVIGFGAAYVVNPIITSAQRRWRIPRWLGAMSLLAAGLLVLLGLMLYVVPSLAHQAVTLLENLPHYLTKIGDRLGIDWALLTQKANQAIAPTTQPDATQTTVSDLAARIDLQAVLGSLGHLLGTGLGVVGTALGSLFYLGMVAVIVGFCFVSFSSSFDHIVAWCGSLIPPGHRDKIIDIVSKMDRSVSGFVRGRLIQALLMAVILTGGWGIAGVPYWLLLGIGGGVLNLVPYGPSVAWLAAVALTWLDSFTGQSGFNAMHVLLWPSVVYFLAQVIDGWIVEPIVQGKATSLDPLSVLLAVLIGGSLFGLLGLILAIPVAACVNILAQEVILPRLRSTA